MMKLKQHQMTHPKLVRLRNLLRRKDRTETRKRIYKDKSGNIYYKFRDDKQIPAARLRVGEIAGVEAELCISSKDGVMLTDGILKDLEEWTKSPKSRGLADAMAKLVELRRRFESLAEEETLKKLATVYFTMNDEDPEHYIESQQQKKLDAWDIDSNAKDFFLCRAAEVTKFFGDTSDKDILMYLKQNQPSLAKAAQFLKKSGLNNT